MVVAKCQNGLRMSVEFVNEARQEGGIPEVVVVEQCEVDPSRSGDRGPNIAGHS
jgi:hypothetical protein